MVAEQPLRAAQAARKLGIPTKELRSKGFMHMSNHHSARASGVVRRSDPVLDRYLEFVESRAQHNTVLASQ